MARALSPTSTAFYPQTFSIPGAQALAEGRQEKVFLPFAIIRLPRGGQESRDTILPEQKQGLPKKSLFSLKSSELS